MNASVEDYGSYSCVLMTACTILVFLQLRTSQDDIHILRHSQMPFCSIDFLLYCEFPIWFLRLLFFLWVGLGNVDP